jgi:hypothetical protein
MLAKENVQPMKQNRQGWRLKKGTPFCGTKRFEKTPHIAQLMVLPAVVSEES